MSSREWIEKRIVQVALSPAELRSRSKAMGKQVRDVAALEADERERAKAARAAISQAKAKITALAAVVESGEEPRELSVRCVADPVRGVLELYRPDTGELMGTAPLEASQLALDGSEHPIGGES